MEIRIRTATAEDLPAINAIYNHYVLHSTCTFQEEPSTAEERAAWFSGHGAEYPVTVAVDENATVIGWGALNRFHPRSAYRRTVEDSVYVRSDSHRKGIGKAILDDLMQRARQLGHREIIGLIAADQPGSLELHRKAGFREAGRLKGVGYKFERWLDVVYVQWSANAQRD